MNAAHTSQDFERLLREHCALLRVHGQVQTRCSAIVADQAAEIRRLEAQAMRARAEVIVRDTVLAWAREDRAELDATLDAWPTRNVSPGRMASWLDRLKASLRRSQSAPALDVPAQASALEDEELADLEATLVAADLVICQTGCLSHGAYWRVQDHCRRTGKTCVLVEEPDALRILRLHPRGETIT